MQSIERAEAQRWAVSGGQTMRSKHGGELCWVKLRQESKTKR
jgi:hypothetical protein